MFEFQIKHECSNTFARTGVFRTKNGVVRTPKFMPVGTLGTVKGISSGQLESTGAEMILANTFHLHIQPGEKTIKDSGGIHKFMNWNSPILTDSGGYQVFSLATLNQINDEGVVFKNPRNGDIINLTPERAIQIQNDLGADVIMAFDQCPPHDATESQVDSACNRTLKWLDRCLSAHKNKDQALFGIVQGGGFTNLRLKSLKGITGFELPGYAIGGVSVGEPILEMHQVIRDISNLLPHAKPRYLMGIGTLREISIAVANGIDLFDCVLPTRLGRHGAAMVREERWNLKNSCFKNDFRPLDNSCLCETCSSYSRAYLHHLIKSREMLGFTLLSLHNITNLIRYTNAISLAIEDGCFSEDFAPWHSESKARHTW